MARHVLVVRTRPVAGQAEAYHRWYDEVHLAEVLALPGFVQARRFAADDPIGRPAEYVAMFDVESDDIDATVAAFHRARAAMTAPPSLDRSSVRIQWWRAVTSGAVRA